MSLFVQYVGMEHTTPNEEQPASPTRAEKHRLYMKTYNRKYVRKSEQKRTLIGMTYDSIYKLAKATAERKTANGGGLKRENGVFTVKSSLRFKEYIERHNRKGFVTYIDADLKDKFTKHCKANGLSTARVLEELLTEYLPKE